MTAVYVIMVLLVPSFLKYRNIYLILASQIFFVCFATDYVNEAFESYGFILIKTFLCRFLYVISVFLFVRKNDDIFIYILLVNISLILNNIFTFAYAKSKIRFSKICFKDLTSFFKPLSVVFLLVNSSMLYTIFDRYTAAVKKCINIDKICIECYDFQQVKALFGVKSAFRCLFL